MVKKYKKPNLSKIEEELYLNKKYTCTNGSFICETSSGFYRVVRDGVSRTYDRLVDAWRSL
jgi:hypothetical protein